MSRVDDRPVLEAGEPVEPLAVEAGRAHDQRGGADVGDRGPSANREQREQDEDDGRFLGSRMQAVRRGRPGRVRKRAATRR